MLSKNKSFQFMLVSAFALVLSMAGCTRDDRENPIAPINSNATTDPTQNSLSTPSPLPGTPVSVKIQGLKFTSLQHLSFAPSEKYFLQQGRRVAYNRVNESLPYCVLALASHSNTSSIRDGTVLEASPFTGEWEFHNFYEPNYSYRNVKASTYVSNSNWSDGADISVKCIAARFPTHEWTIEDVQKEVKNYFNITFDSAEKIDEPWLPWAADYVNRSVKIVTDMLGKTDVYWFALQDGKVFLNGGYFTSKSYCDMATVSLKTDDYGQAPLVPGEELRIVGVKGDFAHVYKSKYNYNLSLLLTRANPPPLLRHTHRLSCFGISANRSQPMAFQTFSDIIREGLIFR